MENGKRRIKDREAPPTSFSFSSSTKSIGYILETLSSSNNSFVATFWSCNKSAKGQSLKKEWDENHLWTTLSSWFWFESRFGFTFLFRFSFCSSGFDKTRRNKRLIYFPLTMKQAKVRPLKRCCWQDEAIAHKRAAN